MTNFESSSAWAFFGGVFGALVAATTLASTTTTFAAPRYDGLWCVSIVTEKGDCDRGYRYPIRISNGQLANAATPISTSPARSATPAPSP
jgi:hypothetical protein